VFDFYELCGEWLEVCGLWVDILRKGGVNERVVRVALSRGVVCDVEELVVKVFPVANAVFMETFLPDSSLELIAYREGEAAFNELRRTFDGFSGREENVKVIRHDDEAVEQVAALFPMAKEDGEEEFGVCGSLEDAKTVVGDGCESEGLGLEAHGQG